MSEIALHPTSANLVTCVPDYFIDRFMAEANGEYVKIYLYLLRSLGRNTDGFSISKISEALDHTQKDVRKALHYWEKQGLLELNYDDCHELRDVYLRHPEDNASLKSPAEIPAMPVADFINSSPVTEDEELKDLLYVAEKLFGHPLTGDTVDKIIFWHDKLGLNWNLVEYIIEYSVDKGAPHINYMDKIALSYANEGITTVDEAKTHGNAYLSTSFAIKSAFGISGRNLGTPELEYVRTWTVDMGFSNELISEACKRTLLAVHEPNFKYADSILSSWHKTGVSSISDLEALDSAYKISKTNANKISNRAYSNKKNYNYPDSSHIDFEELERKLFKF